MANDKTDFENLLSQLEKTADKLENPDVSLEEAIKLYEKGMELSKECTQILENAKQKITLLTEAENGEKDDD